LFYSKKLLEDFRKRADEEVIDFEGNYDKIFIPIENSTAGGVLANLDTIVANYNSEILIEEEYIHPIKQAIGSIFYKDFSSINEGETLHILSHVQPIEQCTQYINNLGKKLKTGSIMPEYMNSTQEAINKLIDNPKSFVIASEFALKKAGFNIIEKDIQDNPNNATRFFLLGREKTKPTGNDKTSIAITLPAYKAGALYEVLGVLANSTPPINMTKIESRPTKDEMGEYWFFIDIEGHQDDPHIGKALEQIKAKSKEYKFLGSYPRFRK
jgi:prephenate dehydratase